MAKSKRGHDKGSPCHMLHVTLKGELKMPLITTCVKPLWYRDLMVFDESWGKPESFKGLPQIVVVEFVIGFLLVKGYNGVVFFHYICIVYYGFC